MAGLRRYLAFTRNSFARILSYRATVLMYVLGGMTQPVILFFLWRAVFAGADAGGGTAAGGSAQTVINGFSFPQMVGYLLFTVLAGSLIYGNADEVIANEVMDGSIAMNLARPLDYRRRVFFDHLGEVLYNFIAIGLPSLTLALVVLGSAGRFPSAANLALGALSLGMAFFLNFYYRFSLGLMAMVTTNMWGLTRLEAVVANFLSGALIPLAFFPLWARETVQYLPYASLVYAPAMAFLGMLGGAELLRLLAVQAAWVFAFRALSGAAWRGLTRRLAINGG
jgi:ABC-2 type transport system permease protein